MTQLRISLFLDNDKPILEASNQIPMEGTDVTLTCNKRTSDTVTGYKWYKGGEEVHTSATDTYTLPDNKRANSGQYSCKVTTTYLQASPQSDRRSINFLCKLFIFVLLTKILFHCFDDSKCRELRCDIKRIVVGRASQTLPVQNFPY